MKTCWIIYRYTDRLSVYSAVKFTGDTYGEIEKEMQEWKASRKHIEIIDVTESLYEEDEE